MYEVKKNKTFQRIVSNRKSEKLETIIIAILLTIFKIAFNMKVFGMIAVVYAEFIMAAIKYRGFVAKALNVIKPNDSTYEFQIR